MLSLLLLFLPFCSLVLATGAQNTSDRIEHDDTDDTYCNDPYTTTYYADDIYCQYIFSKRKNLSGLPGTDTVLISQKVDDLEAYCTILYPFPENKEQYWSCISFMEFPTDVL